MFAPRPGHRHNRGRVPPPPNAAVSPLGFLDGEVRNWLRADRGITFGTGSGVATWTSIVNAHAWSPPASNTEPTWGASSGPNGTPAVTFDGVANVVRTLAMDLDPPGTTPIYIAMVVKQVARVTNDRLLITNSGGPDIRQGASDPRIIARNVTEIFSDNGALGSWALLEYQLTNSTADFLRVGAEADVTGVNTANVNPGAQWTLGGNQAAPSAGCASIVVAEMIIVNGLQSAASRAALYTYIASRYGEGLA
jgi:hypothetical protein